MAYDNPPYYISAYATAVKRGFRGTESEWLASLKGDKGDTGDAGPRGERGLQGAKGDKGDVGDTGPQGVSGVAVATSGMVAFNVDESGHLLCSYTGDEQPDYYIGEDGHLYLDLTVTP